MLYVYIGWLDDPHFKWEGGNWSGNVPRRRFPSEGTLLWGGFDLFNKVASRIERGIYVGDQTDWGGFVAKMSKEQLKQFIAELYRDSKSADLADRLAKDQRDASEFVDALDPDKQYALVACEDDT